MPHSFPRPPLGESWSESIEGGTNGFRFERETGKIRAVEELVIR